MVHVLQERTVGVSETDSTQIEKASPPYVVAVLADSKDQACPKFRLKSPNFIYKSSKIVSNFSQNFVPSDCTVLNSVVISNMRELGLIGGYWSYPVPS